MLWSCDKPDNKDFKKQSDLPTYPHHNEMTVEFDDAEIVDERGSNNDQISDSVSGNTTHHSDNKLSKKYQRISLKVLDCSEIILDGSSTLVITFSLPLDPDQKFDNLVRLTEEGKSEIDGHWELSNNGLELYHRYLAPKQKLVVNVNKAITGINGTRLSHSYQTSIITRNRNPVVGFTSSGSLLPIKSMSGLPVTTLNVDQIDVNFYRIKDNKINEFMQEYGALSQLSIERISPALSYANLIYTSRFKLSPKLNSQENVIIDLSNINELTSEGVYIAVMNPAGSYRYSNPVTVFSISNIGMSAHRYNNDRLAVFAHRLDNGRALSDIKLTALCDSYNKKCGAVTAETNKQGYAELKLDASSNYKLLTAGDGEQMSFIYLDRNALDLSEFNIAGSVFDQKQLFTFDARDLYRPEETVYLNALLRDADGKLLPEQPIKVEIISPTGQVVKEFTWQPVSDSGGFYQMEYTIPANAVTGKWAFKLNLGDDIYRYHPFSVEEFQPERVALTLIPTSEKAILTNSDATFGIKGWYLYGAPASGNAFQAIPTIEPVRTIDALPGFRIGSITETNINRKLNSIDQSLDSHGVSSIFLDKQYWQDVQSPINIITQINLLDAGGRSVKRTVRQQVWPADRMPAIKPLFSSQQHFDWSLDQYVNRLTVEKGKQADFDIAFVDSMGNKFSSEALTARLIKERQNYYWAWTETNGWQMEYELKEFILSEQKVNIKEGNVAKLSFFPNDEGIYRLEVVDNKNHVMSSERFWCGSDWSDMPGVGAVRPDQVRLSLNKSAYSVGDTATVHIDAPMSGAGYISLETNNSTLWVKQIKVPQKGIDIDIPIKNWGRHDIYINAMVIRPSTDSTVQTVKRAIGLLHLPINTASRELKVKLDVPLNTYPKNTIKAKVSVPGNQRKKNKITVLISAVDSGILGVTNFTTPDPYSAFLGRKRYNVEQFDVYDKLIEGQGRQVSMAFGGDNDAFSEQGMLTNNKQTQEIVAQQLQTITLNDKGEGEAELAIPDFNGELRIMAQAWSDDQFGRSEQTITVATPVVSTLLSPRFLSRGDKVIMAVELKNLTQQSQSLNLKLSTDNLLSLERDRIPESINIEPQEQRIIQIPVIAADRFGTGHITLDINNIRLGDKDKHQLSHTWDILVRPVYPPITRTSTATLNEGEAWGLSSSALSDFVKGAIDGEVVVTHKPSLNIVKYIKFLQDYPYGNLEQSISKLYPELYINAEQLTALGIDTKLDEDRRKKVQIGIDRLFTLQRNNGSFGLWNKESEEEYWLTAYAVDFLLSAQERGYQVNPSGLSKALNRLSQYLYDNTAFYNLNNDYDVDVNIYTEFAAKSYAALILAKQQKITPAIRNELKRLYQQVRSNESAVLLSPLPIMQLSIASQLTGTQRIAKDLLDIALTTTRDTKYHWLGDYGSAIRDRAQIYNLMVEYQLTDVNQTDYLLSLINSLSGERYLSTQELSTLFMVSWNDQLMNDREDLAVLFNRQAMKGKEPFYRSMDYKQLTTDSLRVQNPYNSPPLHVRFSLTGYIKKRPKPTSADGVLAISRQYYDIQGNPITAEKLNVGDLVVAVLDITSDRLLNDTLVVDVLPAGLELENPNLNNNSIDLQSIPQFAELLKNESINDVKFQEYLNDRYIAAVNIHKIPPESKRYNLRLAYLARAATIGEYFVPAPFVQSMYKPDWFGIGNSLDLMLIQQPKQD